jgi:hypothetical protein
MSVFAAVLAVTSLWPGADAEKPVPVRYFRLVDGQFVLECEVTTTRSDKGTTYVSRTDHGGDKNATLTIHFDPKNRLEAAEVVQEMAKGKKTASLTLQGENLQLKHDTISDYYKVTGDPVVTTAPDWSDIFQLVRRYDGKMGGRQEFPGVWFHPTEPLKLLTFSIERVGNDTLALKDKAVVLDRFRVKLRSGDYLAWAETTGRVCKLVSLGDKPMPPVVLEGYEEATRELGK